MIAIMQEYGEVVGCVAALSMWATKISSFEPIWARKNPGCLFLVGLGGVGFSLSIMHARMFLFPGSIAVEPLFPQLSLKGLPKDFRSWTPQLGSEYTWGWPGSKFAGNTDSAGSGKSVCREVMLHLGFFDNFIHTGHMCTPRDVTCALSHNASTTWHYNSYAHQSDLTVLPRKEGVRTTLPIVDKWIVESILIFTVSTVETTLWNGMFER